MKYRAEEGRDEVVLLEAVCLFAGRDHRLLHGAADNRGGAGRAVLRAGLWDDCFYDCTNADFRRSDFRLAVACVHYYDGQRRAAVLPGDSRAILI